MTGHLDALAWPLGELGSAIDGLARRSGLEPRGELAPALPVAIVTGGYEAISSWVDATAEYLGVEAEAIAPTHADVAAT
jgi:hypothetical protein